MIEEVLRNILIEKTGEKVLTEEPRIISGRFIIIERTSGGMEEHIRNAVIRVRSFAESMYEACKMSEKVLKIMQDATEHEEISSIRVNQEYNYTDTTAKRYCYQILFDVVYFAR